MKKILFSLMTVVLVVGMVGGGAFAQFFDTETSSGNTFTAGILDLELGDYDEWGDGVSCSIVYDNLIPGEFNEEEFWTENFIVIHLKESSTMPAHVYLDLDVEDNGGVLTEPEEEAEAEAGMAIDDISSVIYVVAVFGGGPDFDPEHLEALIEAEDWDAVWDYLEDYIFGVWEEGTLEDLAEGTDEDPFYLGEFEPCDYYWIVVVPFLDEDAGNEYQGDQSVVTFTFNAYQNEQ